MSFFYLLLQAALQMILLWLSTHVARLKGNPTSDVFGHGPETDGGLLPELGGGLLPELLPPAGGGRLPELLPPTDGGLLPEVPS